MEHEQLYTVKELLQLIYGLMNVYNAKPWYIKWLYKPWHDALQTLALQVGAEEIIARATAQDAIDAWEDNLEE